MNWLAIILVAVFGFFVAGAADGLLVRRRRGWTGSRRIVTAALLPPALVLLGCAAGWLASSPGSDAWRDLITPLWLTLGLVGGLAALAGGLAGALTAEQALRS
jgi:hypothetical protein